MTRCPAPGTRIRSAPGIRGGQFAGQPRRDDPVAVAGQHERRAPARDLPARPAGRGRAGPGRTRRSPRRGVARIIRSAKSTSAGLTPESPKPMNRVDRNATSPAAWRPRSINAAGPASRHAAQHRRRGLASQRAQRRRQPARRVDVGRGGGDQHGADDLGAEQLGLPGGQRHDRHAAHGVADQDDRAVAGAGGGQHGGQVRAGLLDGDVPATAPGTSPPGTRSLSSSSLRTSFLVTSKPATSGAVTIHTGRTSTSRISAPAAATQHRPPSAPPAAPSATPAAPSGHSRGERPWPRWSQNTSRAVSARRLALVVPDSPGSACSRG